MSEIDIYMGIDCGLDGAIVCLSSEGIVDMIEMPTKKQDGKRSIDIEKLAELIKKIYYEVRVCRSYQPGGHRFNKANPDVILENFHITIEDRWSSRSERSRTSIDDLLISSRRSFARRV